MVLLDREMDVEYSYVAVETEVVTEIAVAISMVLNHKKGHCRTTDHHYCKMLEQKVLECLTSGAY